ncbi:MAG TPA: glycosyltransferase family 39 protein [Ktedonobacterales bacterium]
MEIAGVPTRRAARPTVRLRRSLTSRVNASTLVAHAPLALVLALQAIISLVTLNNTPFEDEALYIYAGRQVLHALITQTPLSDPFPRYLSGSPYFYPLLAGAVDGWGGVQAARALSLVAMLVVTACVYWIAGHLFGRETALFSAALYGFQGTTLFLGRLATYDAFCLMFLALSTALALRASATKSPFLSIALGPLLTLAILDKYVALLWTPSALALLAWLTLRRWGWRQMAIRLDLAVIALVLSAATAYAALGSDLLQSIMGSTTNRAVVSHAARLPLVWEVISLGGITLGLALAGLLLANRSQRVTAAIFLASALLAPAYHIYKAEPISLNKHIAYALFFAAPLAGFAVTCVSVSFQRAARQALDTAQSWLPGLGVCLVIFTLGMQQANWQYHQWGNTTGMASVLRTLVRPDSGRYLAEDMEVARYALQDVTADWQWTGPYWFEYTSASGQYFSGVAAYQAALADGYFDVVELSYGATAPLDIAIQSELGPGSHYILVAKVPYHDVFGNGYYWIWRKQTPG